MTHWLVEEMEPFTHFGGLRFVWTKTDNNFRFLRLTHLALGTRRLVLKRVNARQSSQFNGSNVPQLTRLMKRMKRMSSFITDFFASVDKFWQRLDWIEEQLRLIHISVACCLVCLQFIQRVKQTTRVENNKTMNIFYLSNSFRYVYFIDRNRIKLNYFHEMWQKSALYKQTSWMGRFVCFFFAWYR